MNQFDSDLDSGHLQGRSSFFCQYSLILFTFSLQQSHFFLHQTMLSSYIFQGWQKLPPKSGMLESLRFPQQCSDVARGPVLHPAHHGVPAAGALRHPGHQWLLGMLLRRLPWKQRRRSTNGETRQTQGQSIVGRCSVLTGLTPGLRQQLRIRRELAEWCHSNIGLALARFNSIGKGKAFVVQTLCWLYGSKKNIIPDLYGLNKEKIINSLGFFLFSLDEKQAAVSFCFLCCCQDKLAGCWL